MKTITMPVFRRPNYMKQALEALRLSGPSSYKLYIGVEPGCQGTLDLARSVSFMECVVTVNPEKYGVARNAKSLLDRVFRDGSVYNIHIEEDVIITPDAVALSDWFDGINEDYVCLGLVNYSSDPNRPLDILDTNYYAPIGWCVKKNKWESLLAPEWMNDIRGFDFSINNTLVRTKGRTLHPALSRSNHIGRDGGVHCTTEYHDRMFSKLPISPGTYRDGFKIIKP